MRKPQEQIEVAIIGSGPAGYYTAEALAKNLNFKVDIIEKLPTPYGLIRGGVAPDHQSIKEVCRRYEKTSLLDNVRFLGGIEVGNTVSLQEIRELYHAVVLAVGAPIDRELGIPGQNKKGVIGSAAFVGWYNSHPKFSNLQPSLDVKSIAIIGNGNVAVDVARVLAKTPAEMIESDLAPYAAETIHKSPVIDIWIVGRRGPLEAKFTPKEIGELGRLTNAIALVNDKQIPKLTIAERKVLEPAVRKNLELLESFTPHLPKSDRKNLHLEFYAAPVEILGKDRVEGIRFERTKLVNNACIGTGEYFEVSCQIVFPCIGYKSQPMDGIPFDEKKGHFINSEGVIDENLYVTGWARRGPTGTIGTNRSDGQEVADKIYKLTKASGRAGAAGLDALLKKRGVVPITFSDWKKIEAAEQKAAVSPCPRVKFYHMEDFFRAVQK